MIIISLLSQYYEKGYFSYQSAKIRIFLNPQFIFDLLCQKLVSFAAAQSSGSLVWDGLLEVQVLSNKGAP